MVVGQNVRQTMFFSMFNGKADLFTYEKICHQVAMRDKDDQPKKKASKKEEKASLQEANRIAAEQDAIIVSRRGESRKRRDN